MSLSFRRFRTGFGAALGAGIVVLLLSFYLAPLPARLHTASSAMLLYRDGTPAHLFLAPDDRWRTAVHLDDIDANYLEALLTIEDKRFRSHPGFDPLSIFRALIQNLLAGEVISGASTITMQLVRVLEPRPRTYSSKLIEVWRAMQLELRLSKDEILEYYLSFIPFGRNIEGVEAASLAYFGHLPTHLEADEIAVLIAVPQNPNARYPASQNKERLQHARDHIATLLHAQSQLPLSPEQSLESAVFEHSVPTLLFAFPREAAHLAMQLRPHLPPGVKLQTTLDKDVQRMVQTLLKVRQEDYAEQGIDNAAIVVVDRASAEYRAIVGGFNFWHDHPGAKIASYSVARSSGSTLKPFLYAHSIDLGIAMPSRKMEDIPAVFRGYKPRNYSETFNGMVSLEESLSRSLNIPFISLLEEIGLNSFLKLLNQMGVHQFSAHREKLGLSVAVGIELTPLELSESYLSLSTAGRYRKTHFLEESQNFSRETLEQPVLGPRSMQSEPLFSSASSWLTERALQKRDRPDFPERSDYVFTNRPLAWKTGTSFGLRDAWSVGWGERYLTTVWFGNLDYTSSSALIGSEAAGPVFFDVMERLERPFATKEAPPDIIPVEVCSYSGLVPTDACLHRETTLARIDRVPHQKCSNHYFIEVDIQTGLRVAPQCRTAESERRSVLVPSTEYLRWSKLPSSLPEIAPQCANNAVISAGGLELRTPQSGRRILLLSDKSADEQKIPLTSNYLDTTAPLYWYVDGAFQGIATSQETLWWVPIEGEHVISVEDRQGHSAQVRITVDQL